MFLACAVTSTTGTSVAGWYLGADRQNCNAACEVQGLSCSDESFATHYDDVNTADKMKEMMGETCDETLYIAQIPLSLLPSVPFIDKRTMYDGSGVESICVWGTPEPTCAASVHGAHGGSAVLQRLCYCTSATGSNGDPHLHLAHEGKADEHTSKAFVPRAYGVAQLATTASPRRPSVCASGSLCFTHTHTDGLAARSRLAGSCAGRRTRSGLSPHPSQLASDQFSPF